MLDNKKLKEVEYRLKNYVAEGTIKTKAVPTDVNFFLKNAENSIASAKLLFDVSSREDLRQATGYLKFNGYLWVINASYYSMFYMARALLDNMGVSLKSELSIHALTFDALVYYFYLTGKLQKELIEAYAEAKGEAAGLLGKETADELIETYFYERNKRTQFTYETGELAMQSKAKTSLERADKFNTELKRIIKK